MSAYVEAANRDAFMAVKQDLLAAFVDCCDRNGARLARNRLQVCSLMHSPMLHASASEAGEVRARCCACDDICARYSFVRKAQHEQEKGTPRARDLISGHWIRPLIGPPPSPAMGGVQAGHVWCAASGRALRRACTCASVSSSAATILLCRLNHLQPEHVPAQP